LVELNRQFGFIDKTGREVIPLQYQDAFDFKEELAAVEVNDKWGFIDRDGKLAIPCRYYDIYDGLGVWLGHFGEGLAAVAVDDKWGLIDRSGKEVVPIKYQDVSAYGFSEGLTSVELNDKWGSVDKTGRMVVEPFYDEDYYFENGKAEVLQAGKKLYLDRKDIDAKYAGASQAKQVTADNNNSKNVIGPVVKTIAVNGLDPTIVGTWKYEQGTTITYWKLNADGSYDYYTGALTPANRSKGTCSWSFDHGVFTTSCEVDKHQSSGRYDFEKKNDPKTGKPTIVVNGYVYINVDNKPPW
jgi:hypothetical protein